MRRIPLILVILVIALVVGAFAWMVYALDPPHDSTNSITCTSCHKPHNAQGGAITTKLGNANLCESCHLSGVPSMTKPFNENDQAFPLPGVPSGIAALCGEASSPSTDGKAPCGTSHRWDSGASGHVKRVGGNSSPGEIQSGGVFTGRYAKTYTITITNQGDVGAATFSWTCTRWSGDATCKDPPGTGNTTGPVSLDEGITVTFTNGTSSPSFKLNDQWRVYVRTDINQPNDAAMAARIFDGKIACSTCHDQHSQARTPFDPNAPAYGSPYPPGRHYQRLDNVTNEMCRDCHSARDKQSLSGQTGNLTHPVGVTIPGGSYKSPNPPLYLDKSTSTVQCLSCHQVHYFPATSTSCQTENVPCDGTLLRMKNITALCTDCHTLADTASGSHFNTSTGVLWPGGQYGSPPSTFPQVTDTTKRGFCTNCHQPHGWPDASAPSKDYPKLQVESQPNLCFTCHDGNPASDQMTDFSGTIWVTGPVGASNNLNLNTRHDVKSADQTKSGAVIKCSNCHDPHTATSTAKTVTDPDPNDGRVPAPGQTWAGSDLRSEWCLDCHDGSFPTTITPPTTPLTNIRNAYQNLDRHGMQTGASKYVDGSYGWVPGDVVPCTACHDAGHGTTNLFQLRTTVYSKDGTTPIPSLGSGSTIVAFTDNGTKNKNTSTNGYAFCKTCHRGGMGSNSANCPSCHYHGSGNF